MMKKLCYLLCSAAVAVVMVACGGSSSTPGDAAKGFVEDMASGNYESVVDNIAFPEEMSAEDIENTKNMYLSLLKEKAGKEVEAKEGLKTAEVVSETVAEDGNTADVEVKVVYNNGDEKTEDVKLVKVGGSWKIDPGK